MRVKSVLRDHFHFDWLGLEDRRRGAPLDDEPAENRRALLCAFPGLANLLETDDASLGGGEGGGDSLGCARSVRVDGGEEVNRASGERDLNERDGRVAKAG